MLYEMVFHWHKKIVFYLIKCINEKENSLKNKYRPPFYQWRAMFIFVLLQLMIRKLLLIPLTTHSI